MGILDRVRRIRPSTDSPAFYIAFAQLKSVDDRNLVTLEKCFDKNCHALTVTIQRMLQKQHKFQQPQALRVVKTAQVITRLVPQVL